MTSASLLAALRARLVDAGERFDNLRAGAHIPLLVYVDDSAQRQATIVALDDAVRVMADPLGEVRAWLVADLHAMGMPRVAEDVAVRPATVNNLAMVAGRMSKADIGMLSPRTRAALGIGGGT